MSHAVLRWSAIPLGLLAFGLRLARTVWVTPLTWEMSTGRRFLILLTGDVVALAIPIVIFWLLARRLPVSRARFIARDGRLIAAHSPIYVAWQAIGLMYVSSALVLFERVPGGDSLRPFDWPFSVIAVSFAWTAAVAILLVRRPRLELDPEGLTLIRPFQRARVSWDRLIPGQPTSPSKKDHALRACLHGDPVAGNRPRMEIPHRSLHIDPTFLADALRHYGEHPEDRAAIGTTPMA